jgi:hypothetical protein
VEPPLLIVLLLLVVAVALEVIIGFALRELVMAVEVVLLERTLLEVPAEQVIHLEQAVVPMVVMPAVLVEQEHMAAAAAAADLLPEEAERLHLLGRLLLEL